MTGAMQMIRAGVMTLLAAATAGAQAPQPSSAPQPEPSAAEKLFQAGKFAEARKEFERAAKRDKKDHAATMRRGHIALLENRFKEAEKWLRKAEALKPDHKGTKALLGELYYRQDDFARAAPLFRAADREVLAKKLEGFAGKTPYEIAREDFEVRVKWIQTDPLPVVEARVNGSEPVNLLIDTGGAEIILGAEFAKQVGVQDLGGTAGQLAGGRTTVGHGQVERFEIGGLEIRNVPVQMLDARAWTAGAPGKRVEGIIGSVFLYHFLSTMDYGKGELVLRPRGKKSRFESSAKRKQSIAVPFWLIGDHFMLAWGRINRSGPMLWFVDTGLAGGGFIGTAATLKEAGIEAPAQQGQPGAVVTDGSRFVVDELALGDAVATKINGLQGNLSTIGGVKIGGLISHQFFKEYAVTLDFEKMRLFLSKSPSK